MSWPLAVGSSDPAGPRAAERPLHLVDDDEDAAEVCRAIVEANKATDVEP